MRPGQLTWRQRGWLWLRLGIRLILAVNTAGTAPVWVLFQILGFLQTMLFAAACVTTAQYVWARRHPGA